jgi:hypothetical protein
VYKVGRGKWDHLGFILKASESRGKDDPVIIHFKPQPGFVLFLPQSFTGIAVSL